MSSVVVEEKVETPEETQQYSNIVDEAPPPPIQEEEQPESQKQELPDKFQGKSVEEIVSSYENLEKELGRKGQEIGELRQLTDQILKQQVTTQTETAVEKEVEEVDFFDDPNKAVSKAIENHPKFREFEEQQKVQSARATTQQLEAAHPDYSESTAGKKIYRRADLIRLKTRDPQRYEDLQDEILSAYADGRVK